VSVWAKCVEEMRRLRTAVLAVLALASGLLLVIAARPPTAGLIAAFAVTCTAALGSLGAGSRILVVEGADDRSPYGRGSHDQRRHLSWV
jgi:hypothetical protein